MCWNNKYLFILFIHLSKTYQFFLYFHSGTFFHLLMYSLLTLYWTPLIPKQNVPSFHLLPSSVQPFSVLSSSVLYCTSFPCKTYQLFLYFHPRYNLPPSPVRSSSVLCNFFTWKTFYFLLYFLPLYCAVCMYSIPPSLCSIFHFLLYFLPLYCVCKLYRTHPSNAQPSTFSCTPSPCSTLSSYTTFLSVTHLNKSFPILSIHAPLSFFTISFFFISSNLSPPTSPRVSLSVYLPVSLYLKAMSYFVWIVG